MADLSNWGQHGKIVASEPYGRHIALRCSVHKDIRFFTKNIAPIGARTIFPEGADCPCTLDKLEVVPPHNEGDK